MPHAYSTAKKEIIRRRRAATGQKGFCVGVGLPVYRGPEEPQGVGNFGVSICRLDDEGPRDDGPKRTKRRTRTAILGTPGHFWHPAVFVAKAILAALDPVTAPGKCRTLAEMSPEERRRIEERHGIPPVPRPGTDPTKAQRPLDKIINM